MSLLAVGVSHRTAPVALLEQFAMTADDRIKALHELVESDHVAEALVLATCNRIEVFADVERFHGGVADVSRVLARQAGATVEELSPYVTVHYEDQAVTHLFSVAAGVRSILNFAPVALAASPEVDVRQVDLSVELQVLAFLGQQRLVPVGGSA